MYTDSETLFRDTLARNPECWLCYNNLATARLHGSETDLAQAIEYIDEALRINPLSAEAHNIAAAEADTSGARSPIVRIENAARAT